MKYVKIPPKMIEPSRIFGYDTPVMKKYKSYSINEYLNCLSQRTPVPGGGSAAALVGSLGAALISMAANYSLKKNKPVAVEENIKKILFKSEKIRKRLLELVDLDAQAYQNLVQARRGPDTSLQKKNAALRRARAVPQEVCRLCFQSMELTPYLVQYGNKYLLSDVAVAVEFLQAAFNAAQINVEVNQ